MAILIGENMTIKHFNKNISAENQYIITDVEDNPNGILTFTLLNLYNNTEKVLSIDLSKHKLKLIKTTQQELNRLKNSVNEQDILNRESHIFLAPKESNDEGFYQEFIWVDNDFEIIGSTNIDLDPYFLKENVYNKLDYNQNDANKSLSAYQGYLLNQNKVDKIQGKGLSTNDYTNSDKNKLANIEEEATKTIIDDSFSDISKNPVQNKIIKSELNNKVDKVVGKELSTNDYTDNEKNKLAEIEEKANKTIVTDSLSSTSTNPVQSKVIKAALDNKVDKIDGYGLSQSDFTIQEKTKLSTLAKVAMSGDYSDLINTPDADQQVYFFYIQRPATENVINIDDDSINTIPGEKDIIFLKNNTTGDISLNNKQLVINNQNIGVCSFPSSSFSYKSQNIEGHSESIVYNIDLGNNWKITFDSSDNKNFLINCNDQITVQGQYRQLRISQGSKYTISTLSSGIEWIKYKDNSITFKQFNSESIRSINLSFPITYLVDYLGPNLYIEMMDEYFNYGNICFGFVGNDAISFYPLDGFQSRLLNLEEHILEFHKDMAS